MNLDDFKDENGKFATYAWPGGYPIIYICEDGEIACADCVNDASNHGWAFDERGNRVIAGDVFYEGAPVTCVNCHKEIESAYGDPEVQS